MKITKRQLRRLINEAINEHRTLPDMSGVPSQHLDKIHDLIDSGDVEMARSLIDAFGGPTDYPESYIEYGEVGDLEKLGNKAAELHAKIPKDEYGFSKMGDMAPIYDIDAEARALAKSKVLRDHPMDPEMGLPSDEIILPDQYAAENDQLRRYYGNRNRNPEGEEYFSGVDFSELNEHRLKPTAANISPDHLSKIDSLIDGGSIDQARSLIDALGGPADYVDDYIEYSEVGDMEKLGNEVADLFKPMDIDSIDPGIGFPSRDFKPGFDYDDMHALDDEATALARDKREKARGSGMSGFEAEDAYDTHIERYFGNRNRPVRRDEFLE